MEWHLGGRIMTVPTLDLSVFRETHSEGEFVESLRPCCHEGCGFFYLTGHTVPLELIESVEKAMKRAFKLPEHTKATIDKAHSRVPYHTFYHEKPLQAQPGVMEVLEARE